MPRVKIPMCKDIKLEDTVTLSEEMEPVKSNKHLDKMPNFKKPQCKDIVFEDKATIESPKGSTALHNISDEVGSSVQKVVIPSVDSKTYRQDLPQGMLGRDLSSTFGHNLNETITDKRNCGNCMFHMPNLRISTHSGTQYRSGRTSYWICGNKQSKYYDKGRGPDSCLNSCPYFDWRYSEPNKVEIWLQNVRNYRKQRQEEKNRP